ncbi:MAG TPA: hypothetical protein VJM11_04010 [Nevskiaceae bacterium]|nr:hypothetical protein [Nevskiaceae bacterium]
MSDRTEMEQLYGLRYRAYVEAMRRTYREIDPGRATIVDALDDGQAIHLGAFAGTELRAVLRLNLGSRSDLGEYAGLYDVANRAWGFPVPDEGIAIGSRFALQPGHESPALALKMALAAHWECLRNDVLRVFVQVEDHMVGFHQSLGFRKPDAAVPDVDGATVMALDPFDRAALRAVRSPLVAQLDGWREHSPIAVASHAFA